VKAVLYHGPPTVSVDEVPDPKIEKPTDALVRITATNICGSDLHMYEGRTDFEEGRIFGHENVGEVIGVGDAVDKIRDGDMISAPFNVACGDCRNCEEGLANYCLRASEPGTAGAAYGFADVGPWQGGQAEMLRVPWADFNCLRYVPQDPGGPNELAKHGKAPFDFGRFWFRGQHVGTGQCPVKRYNRYLRSLIAEDKVKPSWTGFPRPASRPGTRSLQALRCPGRRLDEGCPTPGAGGLISITGSVRTGRRSLAAVIWPGGGRAAGRQLTLPGEPWSWAYSLSSPHGPTGSV
jgi:Alcohol dehydrogenase GroES-like domain